MKAALENAFRDVEVELIKSSGGAFEVRKDGNLVYSKLETGEFPSNQSIIESLQSS